MFYESSKGPIAIGTMPLRYARNAYDKLQRESPERTTEIEEIGKHIASLSAQQNDEPDNPRAVIGSNQPPADDEVVGKAIPKTWEALKLHMDDLLEQARGISGVEITTQAMAGQAGKLLRDLQEAASAADDARIVEKEPFDKIVSEIQDRYNEYIAPMKNKKPGIVSKAVAALSNQNAAWLRKLDDEKKAREAAARAIAEKAQEEALAAHLSAKVSGDLDVIDEAESLMAAAEEAARDLRRVENEKVQVRGEYRAISLRSIWKAVRIEGQGGKALMHFAKTQPDRVIQFVQTLADEEVRAGARAADAIPGFTIVEEKVV